MIASARMVEPIWPLFRVIDGDESAGLPRRKIPAGGVYRKPGVTSRQGKKKKEKCYWQGMIDGRASTTVLKTPPPPPPAHISGYLGNTDEFDMLSSSASSNSTSCAKCGCYCWDSGAMFCVGEEGGGEGEGEREGEGKGREREEEKCSYDAAKEGFYYS